MKRITKFNEEVIDQGKVKALPFALVIGIMEGNLVTILRSGYKASYRVAVVTDIDCIHKGNEFHNPCGNRQHKDNHFETFQTAFEFITDLENIKLYYFENLKEYYEFLANNCT